jgi:hypothetical protein
MTPTGLLGCVLLVSVSIFLPAPYIVPIPSLIFLNCFLLLERRHIALNAIRYALIVVVPIAAYLSVVWILIQGEAPGNSISSYPLARQSSVIYVARISFRLFLFVTLLYAGITSNLTDEPLRFITEIKLPKPFKILVAMTLSITSTIRAATEKAWVSLVTANLLTPRVAWRNIRHCPLLLLTIWMSIVGTLSTRLETKWTAEDVDARLQAYFSSDRERSLTPRDLLWLTSAVAAVAFSIAGALS